MRYSQLSAKEIVNIDTGEKLGDLSQLDMVIDDQTGKITELLIPGGQHFSMSRKPLKTILWRQIRTFGEDMVLISLQSNNQGDK